VITKARQTQAFDHRFAGQRGVRGVGATTGAVDDGQISANFLIDGNRFVHQLAAFNPSVERRTAPGNTDLHLRVGKALFSRARFELQDGGFQVFVAHVTHIGIEHSFVGDDVGDSARLGHGPVKTQAACLVVNVLRAQHQIGRLYQRVDPLLGRGTGMRRLALDAGFGIGDTGSAQRQAFPQRQRRLEGQHKVVFFGQRLYQVAGTERAFFFIGVEHDTDGAEFLKALGLEHTQRMQNDGDAALVVGNARAKGAVAIDAERCFFQRSLDVHGIHVGDQQQTFAALALQTSDDVLADHITHRLVPGDGEAQAFELAFKQLPHGRQAFGVAGAGFDVDQALQRLDRGRLLGGGRSKQLVVAGLGPACAGDDGSGQRHGGADFPVERLVHFFSEGLSGLIVTARLTKLRNVVRCDAGKRLCRQCPGATK